MGNTSTRRLVGKLPFGTINTTHRAPADAQQALENLNRRLLQRKQLYNLARLQPPEVPHTLADAAHAIAAAADNWQEQYANLMRDLDQLDSALSTPVVVDADAASRVLALAVTTRESAVSRVARQPLGEVKVLRIIKSFVAPSLQWFDVLHNGFHVRGTCVDATDNTLYFFGRSFDRCLIGWIDSRGIDGFKALPDSAYTYSAIAAHGGVVCAAGYDTTDTNPVHMVWLSADKKTLKLDTSTFVRTKDDALRHVTGLRELLVDTTSSENPFRLVTEEGAWEIVPTVGITQATPLFKFPEDEKACPLAIASGVWAMLTAPHLVLFSLTGPAENPIAELVRIPIADMRIDEEEDNEILTTIRRPGASTERFYLMIAQSARVIEVNGAQELITLEQDPSVLYDASFECGDQVGNIWTHNASTKLFWKIRLFS